MSYIIQYDPELNHKFPAKKEASSSHRWITTLLLVAMLLFVMSFSGVLDVIKDLVLPGDSTVAKAAFADLMDDLETGVPVTEAFADFCVEIIKDESTSG